MARTLTPIDVYAIVNAMVEEATGQQATLQAVDTSSFIAAGETILATGYENTLNALGIVMGRTFMAVRPYDAKLKIINAKDGDLYTSRMRKISFYNRVAQPAGDWNTQLFTNLEDGFDNGENPNASNQAQSTKSMWVQNQPVPLEMNFGGVSVWQDSTTVYKYQLKQAFRSEAEFADFVAGIMTEKGNDIESQKEAYNRAVLLNGIAGAYDMNATGTRVNLTEEFNTRFGTNYTSAQLRSTYLDQFLKFFVARVKQISNFMEERSVKYHWAPTKPGHVLLRHTPKSRQKMILYKPLFIEAEAWVMPEIFNTEYLSIDNYEGISYWQNNVDANRPSINITPAVTDKTTGVVTSGDPVNLDYVVGCLYDTDAMMTYFNLDDAETTPMEARKRYYNIWYSFARNGIYDPTENFVVFYMADPAGGDNTEGGETTEGE